jgi:hypothetical protein
MRSRRIEPLWSVDDVSVFLGVPLSAVYQWRYRRVAPRASRVGRHLHYDPADVRPTGRVGCGATL